MIKWLSIILGVTVMAIGLNSFLEPCSLVIGGATGIAVISESLWGIPMSITNLVINAPLLIIALRLMGFSFVKDTLYATLLLSLALEATKVIPPVDTDIVLSAVFGGILTGTGLGLVFRFGATTGGSDLAARLIHRYYPAFSISRIMLVLDVCIILGGAFVLGLTPAMYAVVTVYVLTKVIDVILGGVDYAKAVFIISEKSDMIGRQMMTALKRGATYINCKGMYTDREKGLVLMVVSARQIVKLKTLAESIDPGAFIIVNDVREIRGDFR